MQLMDQILDAMCGSIGAQSFYNCTIMTSVITKFLAVGMFDLVGCLL